MKKFQFFSLPPLGRCLILATVIFVLFFGYWLWSPGIRITDGRHDRGRNGIWMTHAFLGDDVWFRPAGKPHLRERYRDSAYLTKIADLYRHHHVTDLFPHLCPAKSDGSLPRVDDLQVERVLDIFAGTEFRVMPWVGGVNQDTVQLENPQWRRSFVNSCRKLWIATRDWRGFT